MGLGGMNQIWGIRIRNKMGIHKYYWLRLILPLGALIFGLSIKSPYKLVLYGYSLGYFWAWLYGINWVDFEKINKDSSKD